MNDDVEAANLSLQVPLSAVIETPHGGRRTSLNSFFSIQAAWTCFQTLNNNISDGPDQARGILTECFRPFSRSPQQPGSPRGK